MTATNQRGADVSMTKITDDPDEAAVAASSGSSVILVIDTSARSEEHTSELQSPDHLVCRLLLEKKKNAHIHAAARDVLQQYVCWFQVAIDYWRTQPPPELYPLSLHDALPISMTATNQRGADVSMTKITDDPDEAAVAASSGSSVILVIDTSA